MTTSTSAPTDEPVATSLAGTLRSRFEDLATHLEERSSGRDPIESLLTEDLAEADRNGYLDGLGAAARRIRSLLAEESMQEAVDGPTTDPATRSADGPAPALADTVAVADFMHAIEQTVRTVPTTHITETERGLRPRLVLEEALEYVAAMGCVATVKHGLIRRAITKGDVAVEIDHTKEIDLVEATDAIADIMVVTKGSAHTLGVPVDEAFDIVHVTNMAKVGGPVREDGKRGKPEGWVGPTEHLRNLLVAHGWTG